MLIVGSGPFTPDPPGQLDVLGHDGHPLSVNSLQTEDDEMVDTVLQKHGNTYAKIGVLEKTNKVRFASFLQCHDSRALKPQVGLEVLSDLADQTLERELANEQLCGLLIPEDLTVRKRRTGFQLAHLLISLRATVPGL